MRICNSVLRNFCFLIFLVLPFSVSAGDEVLEPSSGKKTPALFSVLNSGVADGVRLSNRDALHRFYEETGGNYLWVEGGQFTSKARAVFELIGKSYEHGLNPDVYNRTALASIMGEKFPDENKSAAAELLMTDAVLHYGRDLSGMRLSPKFMGTDWSSWSRGVDPYSLLKLLAEKSDPQRVLTLLPPQDDVYKALQSELKRVLKEYGDDTKTSRGRISYSGVLYPGARHPVVVQLRERFGKHTSPENADLYDKTLEGEIISFQKARGLKPDGVVGPRTVIALNEGLKDRLVKVLANLERRRWVKRPMPSRYVEVNIPAMWLKAVEDRRVSFEMPVIVGRKKRPTMSFVDEIVGIRFNPSWYVPDTIKKEDYLPALQKDPQALAEKGIAFRVKGEEGAGLQTIPPEDIDWANMTEEGLKSIQMVQGPGASNALGQIRVLMPNRYDIYLHDTNAPSLFKKDDRAQSSGCVRLSEPRRIANFVLGHNKGWSEDRLESYLQKGKTMEIKADPPIPVYLFYYTIWKSEDGGLIFGNDLYGLDKELVDVLKSNGQLNFPLI